MTTVRLFYPVVLISFFVLLGCAEKQSGAEAAIEAQSRELRPADAGVRGVYDRSCRSCHTIAATGAPLTGDAAAWSVRMDKGMDTLVENVVNGFGGMPPFGMCMDCSVEYFEALITFMAQPKASESDSGD